MFFDWTFILLIPAMLLAVYARFKVSSTYEKFSKVKTSAGIPGSQLARNLLDRNGLGNIAVEQVPGELTDNYDPRDKKLRLSSGVYNSSSVAAFGIVAHETGHAVQDIKAYFPLKFRSSIVPVSNIGSQLSIPLFFAGLIFSYGPLMDAGIILFSFAVFFTLVTLPVEFNASSRAMQMLSSSGYASEQELGMAKKVLDAAALTYVAATAMAVMQLLRLIALRGSRDD
ncbi:MAG: zinc metallopeptidase [Candidatus Saganbacteria bacterium]|nr:zinc metallopeptidase [Candidatus Saganbacteria bacterium]